MKVKDTLVGCVIETENPLVIEQFKKYNTRYQEIKKKENKNIADTKTAKN